MNRIISTSIVISLMSWGQSALGAIIEDHPDAIVCSVKDPTGFLPWEELVFYVSAHTRNGETLYKTLTSDPVVIIMGSDGRLQASNLKDCDGRTAEELIEDGRAFFLTSNQAYQEKS